MSLKYPDCDVHGPNGSMASQVVRAYTTKGGKTDSLEPRPRWKCVFWLKDGTHGNHKFTEKLGRTLLKDAVCPDCGAPVPEWHGGEPVFKGYVYKLEHIVESLVTLATGGMGATYRSVGWRLRRSLQSTVNLNDSRREKRRALIEQLLATGKPADQRRAAKLQKRRPYKQFSDEANLAEWMVEACADALNAELAPKEWPAGSIVAVDSIKLNLTGTYKYLEAGTNQPFDPQVLEGGEVPEIDPEDYEEVVVPAVEKVERTLDELFEEDEEEEQAPPELTVLEGGAGQPRKSTRGGVPCWQIFGALTYQPNERGEFDSARGAGEPWLLRSYYMPNSLSWAHFFRQLPGTPGWIVCDGAPEIRVGIELAWPNVLTRPKVIACEYHVTEAIRRGVEGHPEMEVEALRLFNTWGRIVDGEYEDHIPNGEPGDELRLWHFNRFVELAEKDGVEKIVKRSKTPTWRRFQAQVLNKDGKLKYSIGALEAQLLQVANTLEHRRLWLTNRRRTDRLLMLALLALRGDAQTDKFKQALSHRIRHGGRLKRQADLVDRGIGSPGRHTRKGHPSLRRPLSDEELRNPRELLPGERAEDVALPTRAEFEVWMDDRAKRRQADQRRERYHSEPDFRAKDLERRKQDHLANPERDRAAQQAYYYSNLEKERAGARARKARRKAEEPEKFAEQHKAQNRRNYERNKKITALVREFRLERPEARKALEEVAWDVETAAALLRGTALKEEVS